MFDSGNALVKAELVAKTRRALSVDGFMTVTGLGIPQSKIERHLAIAQFLTTGTTHSDKLPFAAKLEQGSYRGYKLRGIWTKDGGVPDNIEVSNLLHNNAWLTVHYSTLISRLNPLTTLNCSILPLLFRFLPRFGNLLDTPTTM